MIRALRQRIIYNYEQSIPGKNTFNSNRIPNVIITKYVKIKVTPTDFFSRYPDNVNTTYNATAAINSNKIVYSIPYEAIMIDDLFGSFRLIMFLISHGMPSDIKMASEFAPKELDTPTPLSPFRMLSTLDMPSGMHPPAAKNVRPITASGTENVKPGF